MSAAQRLLDRIIGAKQSAPGRWIARCPAHEDRSPSLSIRETDDGRVLIHCFGGCEPGDVIAAIGLRFSDLFDKPITHHLPPIRGGFSARELLELNSHEALVAAELIETATARNLTSEEAARLRQASARLLKARALVNGH